MKKLTFVLVLSALAVSACSESSDKDNPECNPETGTCDPSGETQCINDTWKCDGNILSKCVSGKWEISQTCAANTMCNAGTGTCDPSGGPKCTNDTWKCDGSTLSKCVSGKWEISQTCAANTLCNAGRGTCDPSGGLQCTNDTWKCDGSALSKCVSGKWEISQTCTENTLCNAGRGTCDPNKIECSDTEHLFADQCEADDVTHCGTHTNDCTQNNGWKTGRCIGKSCLAETCTTGYHLESLFDENNTERTICAEDKHDACGSINKKCKADEVCTEGQCQSKCKPGEVVCSGSCINPMTSQNFCGADVSCSSYIPCSEFEDCVGGKCVLTSCQNADDSLCTGTEQNVCVNIHGSNLRHCGACGAVCTDKETAKASGCKQGQCTYTCQAGMVNCGSDTEPMCRTEEQLKSDSLHCGKCDTKCADNAYCENGQCIISSCTGNECLLNNACINQDTHCGTQCLNCNMANLASAGICQDGTCIITSCVAGFHLTDKSACEIDSAAACPNGNATGTVNCNTLDYTKAGTCEDGLCKATECQANAHIKDNKCVADTLESCGSEDNNCTKIAGWKTGKCENGKCVATTCQSGFCLNPLQGQCTNVQSSTTCGMDGGACVSCTIKQICSAGACAAKKCEGNVCQQPTGADKEDLCQNDDTHCGSNCQNCNTFTDNAAAGACSADGTCQVTACKTGYHIYNNACEADSLTDCGEHEKRCNVGEICVDGACHDPECTAPVCSKDDPKKLLKCVNGRISKDVEMECTENKCVQDAFGDGKDACVGADYCKAAEDCAGREDKKTTCVYSLCVDLCTKEEAESGKIKKGCDPYLYDTDEGVSYGEITYKCTEVNGEYYYEVDRKKMCSSYETCVEYSPCPNADGYCCY